MLRSFAKHSPGWLWGDASVDAWAGARCAPGSARLGCMEGWSLRACDPGARRAIWLSWTAWAGDRDPTRALAEVCAVAFGAARGHVATKTTVPFRAARFDRERLGVAIDGCVLSPDGTHGRVESGGRAITHTLSIESRGASMPHHAFAMGTSFGTAQKVVSLMPEARVSGAIDVDGESWSVNRWPAVLTHDWGRGDSEVYAQGHCSAWDEECGFVVEGATGRALLAGMVVLPAATAVCVRGGATTYALTGPVSLARSRGEVTPRRWRFRARGADVEVDGEMWAESDDFVGLFRPNPDGRMCHRLGTTFARAEVTVRVDGELWRLRSSRAALEIVTPHVHHGVRMYL